MFYENLNEVCKEKGLKVTPTVELCGGKSGSISGWKRGASPDVNLVCRLAEYLQVTTDRLLLGEKELQFTDEEMELLHDWRALDRRSRIRIHGEIISILDEKNEANKCAE